MNGVNSGRAEAGVVVLRPVQRTRPTSLSFHVPVEGERVRRQPEGAGRPDDRSAEHLRQVVVFELHRIKSGRVLPAWEEVGRFVRFWGRSGKLREVEESPMLALPCLPPRSPSVSDHCHDHVDDGDHDHGDGDEDGDHDDNHDVDDDEDDDGDGENDHLSKAFHFQVFCSLK